MRTSHVFNRWREQIAAAKRGLAGVRVLVVEDAWHVAKALKSALEEVGMSVAGPAARIAEAEQLLDQEVPDLAVVDVNLKGEMAYGLIDRLHDRGVRVIVVSGYAVLQARSTRLPPSCRSRSAVRRCWRRCSRS